MGQGAAVLYTFESTKLEIEETFEFRPNCGTWE
jgi:hypothetical protein